MLIIASIKKTNIGMVVVGADGGVADGPMAFEDGVVLRVSPWSQCSRRLGNDVGPHAPSQTRVLIEANATAHKWHPHREMGGVQPVAQITGGSVRPVQPRPAARSATKPTGP